MYKQFCIIKILFFINIFSALSQNSALFESKKIRKDIIKEVKRMEKGVIDAEAVGFSGSKTKQYERFEYLLKNAKDEEFVELTKYNNPVVRGYAFGGLAKRKSPRIKEIILYHLRDTSKITYWSGCIPMELPLNEFMQNILTPTFIDINCIKLDSLELQELTRKMLRTAN